MLKGAEANCVTVNGDCPREGRSPRGTRYTCLPLGGARAGLVVGEIVPRTAVLAVILADRAPLAFHRATPWRRSWGRRISLAPAPRGGEDQVRQSATTEFRFGSRLMVARRRRAGTRALGDAAADHYPDHYNSSAAADGVGVKPTGIGFTRRLPGLSGHRSQRQNEDERSAKGTDAAGTVADWMRYFRCNHSFPLSHFSLANLAGNTRRERPPTRLPFASSIHELGGGQPTKQSSV